MEVLDTLACVGKLSSTTKEITMKKSVLYILAFLLTIGMTMSCSSYHHSHGRGNKGMPPGQAKKVYGKKSAREFAPGQQKNKSKKHHK